jgi:hypothetical protein
MGFGGSGSIIKEGDAAKEETEPREEPANTQQSSKKLKNSIDNEVSFATFESL